MAGRPIRNFLFFSAALFVVIIVLPQSLTLYVDWLWFKDVGREAVFSTKLQAQGICGLAGLLGGFLFSYLNIWIALRATKGRALVIPLHAQALPPMEVLKHIDKIALIVPAAIGLFSAFLLTGNWMTFLSYFHAAEAGYADPIFGRDASFYLFSLPAFEILAVALQFVLWPTLVALAVLYFLRGGIFIGANRVALEPAVSAHFSVMGGLIFLVMAFQSYIGMHTILSSTHGHVAGATYTDVHAVIPFMKGRIVLSLALAALFLANIFLRRALVLAASVAFFIAASFIGTSVYPGILHKFVVAPNELVKETPYIEHNIAFTRKGFGLDAVEERNISGGTGLTKGDINRNSATIKNIRLWDHRPLLDTFSQIQEIRTYYEFVSVGNDRYLINGEYRQTMLSPRELSTASIPTRNWINERLTFTHGYGLTLGPVNQVTPEGLPVLFIKDIPPVSTVPDVSVQRPEIYFGRLTSDYVIVNTKSREFDYPSGEENVFTEYKGSSGVRMDSFFRKLLFAVYFKSLKLLLSDDISDDSRMLFNRNILQRVHQVMPYLMLDADPYMVISESGELFWICDAYTVSRRFPYSQPVSGGINYIRNAVKVTVNAFDGSMAFYLADSRDPLGRTFSAIFPGLFLPIADMPEDLKKHIRYPLDIFGIQTKVYSTYHMDDPQIFYNKEDQWEIPALGAQSGTELMEPYYTIMKLPEEKKEEFILMLPFNPKKKDNLSAWMVARSDGEFYGQLMAYRFPKDKLVYGPKQIVARINQDTEISRQISLWDQRGSQVIQGTLLVIPIENSLIYVQPLYLRAETGKIPELKRVIVAYENRIAMDETLDAALSSIFGEVRVSDTAVPVLGARPQGPKDSAGLASAAKEHFERALSAQRAGNWALYGEEIQKLGNVIRQMQK